MTPPLPVPAPPPAAGPPAHALLRAVARAAVHGEAGVEVRTGGVEWEGFVALAARNRLLPLAHRLLAARHEVPEAVRGRLRAESAANGHRALALSGELRRLVAAMAGKGVRALAYKGPALAVRAYGSLALRTYSDLDLLVAPDDVPAAARVLEGAGYAPSYRLTPAQDALFRRVDGDYPWHHSGTRTLVELHCRVSSSRFGAALPAAELIRRSRSVPLGGGEVPALADDDLFLALCLHGAKHRWARLEWLAAAAALAVRAGIDLDESLRRASRAGARRTVLLALRLMRDEAGMALPASVGRMVDADPPLAALEEEARGLWFAADEAGDTTVANLRFNYRLREGAADRARYAARWLFTPTPEDWAWLRLPEALAPLHRVLRPLRLALRHGRRRP